MTTLTRRSTVPNVDQWVYDQLTWKLYFAGTVWKKKSNAQQEDKDFHKLKERIKKGLSKNHVEASKHFAVFKHLVMHSKLHRSLFLFSDSLVCSALQVSLGAVESHCLSIVYPFDRRTSLLPSITPPPPSSSKYPTARLLEASENRRWFSDGVVEESDFRDIPTNELVDEASYNGHLMWDEHARWLLRSPCLRSESMQNPVALPVLDSIRFQAIVQCHSGWHAPPVTATRLRVVKWGLGPITLSVVFHHGCGSILCASHRIHGCSSSDICLMVKVVAGRYKQHDVMAVFQNLSGRLATPSSFFFS